MKDSLQEIGKQLIAESERIYLRDVQGALQEADSNLAVRRSQEVVELALKGGLKVLGVDYPKVHDVAPVFSEQLRQKRESVDTLELDRIEEISLWLAQARAPAFYCGTRVPWRRCTAGGTGCELCGCRGQTDQGEELSNA